jgi:creatinine amidohydrolase
MMHGWIPAERYFAYLTWTDVRDLTDKANTVILQPVGAIEQHGPHLPVAVDAAICTGVLGEALKRVPREVPCYCLPPLYYGKSNEHIRYPGTITLSAETLLRLLGEVADSVYRMGFRKLAFVNSHGGQPQVMEIAARDARERHQDFSVFPLFIWRVPNVRRDRISAKEREFGIHAGTAETSILMKLLPKQVHKDRLVCEYPKGLPENSMISMEGALPFAWLTHDLTESGALGDATAATEAMGAELLESLAAGWAKLIQELHAFRQPTTSPGPLS